MSGLVVGIDLCNQYTQLNCAGEEKTWTIPTVLCKNKSSDEWHIGEDAYAHTLMGNGVIVDKLMHMLRKSGTATIGNICFQAKDLLIIYLEKILELAKKEYKNMNIAQLVIAVPKLDRIIIETLKDCTSELGIKDNDVVVTSYAESFSYYILNQKKDIWNNTVGMFEVSDERLRYYELKVIRGLKKPIVVSEYQDIESGFQIDVLNSTSGGKLGDKILCSCAERFMEKKLYSSIFLVGKGFENLDWAKGFMEYICPKRKVYMEQHIFSKGASFMAKSLLEKRIYDDFIFVCEGRLTSSISIEAYVHGQMAHVELAALGESVFSKSVSLDLILDGQESFELIITPVDTKLKRKINIVPENFSIRSNKTTKIGLTLKFLDDRTIEITLVDKGFGELFPSSGMKIKQEVFI